eukprot:15435737-Alexandrium_andersonii.AAC.1
MHRHAREPPEENLVGVPVDSYRQLGLRDDFGLSLTGFFGDVIGTGRQRSSHLSQCSLWDVIGRRPHALRAPEA